MIIGSRVSIGSAAVRRQYIQSKLDTAYDIKFIAIALGKRHETFLGVVVYFSAPQQVLKNYHLLLELSLRHLMRQLN